MLTVKRRADGIIGRYKAKLVVQGFTQTFGIDYEQTLHQLLSLIVLKFYCHWLLI